MLAFTPLAHRRQSSSCLRMELQLAQQAWMTGTRSTSQCPRVGGRPLLLVAKSQTMPGSFGSSHGPSIPSHSKATSLAVAAGAHKHAPAGQVEAAKLMLGAGLHVDCRTRKGMTPLMMAAQQGGDGSGFSCGKPQDFATSRKQHRRFDGRPGRPNSMVSSLTRCPSARILASMCAGNAELVGLFLKKKANASATNKKGQSVVDQAKTEEVGRHELPAHRMLTSLKRSYASCAVLTQCPHHIHIHLHAVR